MSIPTNGGKMERAMLGRTAQLWTTVALAALTATALAGACDPGVYEAPEIDAAVGGNPDAAVGGNPDAAGSACEEPSTLGLDGHHLAGNACQSCHYTGANGAPQFTLAGTLYNNSTGATGVPNATIIVTDANNVEHKIITGTFGNFWSRENLVYPIKVSASLCPTSLPMVSTVAGPGDCNSSGCHAQGAPSGRVHLP
jgi:cytochrome c5